MDFRKSQIIGWDKEYRQKGSLWHGPSYMDFKIPSDSRVLELGCGNGKTLSALLNLGCKITAIDSSKRAVGMCRKLAQNKAEVLLADVCELPFKENSFNIVIAFHILEHLILEDRKKAVSEIRRVLSPKGKILLKVFSTEDMRFGKGDEIEENTFLRGKNSLAYHYFSENELRELFSTFKEISLEKEVIDKHYHGKPEKRVRLFASFERPAV